VGGILGGIGFILTMGTIFSGDAPPGVEFDSEGLPLNRKGLPYPRILDPRTGQTIPFPVGPLVKLPENQRTPYEAGKDRAKFITEWHARGYPRTTNGWEGKVIEVHHIRPLDRGGTNEFWNLVPLAPEVHLQFTNYWRSY
jgi:hypothetical protein